jgi:hypothetical protein
VSEVEDELLFSPVTPARDVSKTKLLRNFIVRPTTIVRNGAAGFLFRQLVSRFCCGRTSVELTKRSTLSFATARSSLLSSAGKTAPRVPRAAFGV